MMTECNPREVFREYGYRAIEWRYCRDDWAADTLKQRRVALGRVRARRDAVILRAWGLKPHDEMPVEGLRALKRFMGWEHEGAAEFMGYLRRGRRSPDWAERPYANHGELDLPESFNKVERIFTDENP